ncbi:sugar kinase [Neotabrizicola sp. VNH66]|uniref:sugar kinase n=1 Tax=Neotabrizicola sp. VNH66 TaxID=3400918 RepID=UPI003C081D99
MMRILSAGEVMVELSGAGPGLWRQGIAGDTFNTAAYLAALRPGWQVGYLTRLGRDTISDTAVQAIAAAGIDIRAITRDPDRTIGLYMIALHEGERSFSYWRGQSAARLMAEDAGWLAEIFDSTDVIYLSGITLAILSPGGRDRMLAALSGRRVMFDPNIRPRLWEDPQVMRDTISRAAALSEIVLPSFDDEAAAFGDADPAATAARYAGAGTGEVIVKNGSGPLALWSAGALHTLPAPDPVVPVDTTGAGDSFNAGYLAARLDGADPATAVRAGQRLAALVVQHPGALIPRDLLDGYIRESVS